MPTHNDFMQLALAQARLGLGRCAPNPAVGAVLVRDGVVIKSGYHHGPGLPHAEVEALRDIDNASGCDLYVTLEPCCHHGRTPPCTELIIQKRVSRVFFGFLDPNPIVAGQGQAQLREAGIACELLPSDAIDQFYAPYRRWAQTKMPWVTVKVALSDRGELAVDPLTGPEAQLETHQSRLAHDAILTTANTIIHDNPKMNTRLVGDTVKKPLFILDSMLRTPVDATVFETCYPITLFHAMTTPSDTKAMLIGRGAQLQSVPQADGLLSLSAVLKAIGEQGVHRLWVEAGWWCVSGLIKAALVDELICYVAPHQTHKKTMPIQLCYEGGRHRSFKFNVIGDDTVILIK